MMDLKALQREAHAIAKDHGWWDTERTFGDLIALVHSGLSEALEAYRMYGLEKFYSVDDDFIVPDDYEGLGLKKLEGVGSELADVVIRVADIAEYEGYSLDPIDDPISDWDALELCLRELESFGDWIARLHWITAEATSYKGVASEHLVINALASLIVGVQHMAAHYGIDLDAAIEAKMSYNRTRSYRHGGKAL